MATQDQQNNIQQSNSTLNVQTFKIHGMKHDLSESAFENNFAFENMNMRINIVDSDNTLLNLTNERGTLNTGLTLVGRPIGCKKYAPNKILLITTQDGNSATKDHIYNIKVSDNDVITASEFTINGKNYGFSSSYPIEIEHYHDGEKDFFYLADGLNNFRTFWTNGVYLSPNNDNIDYNKEISGNDMIFAQYIKSNTAEFTAGVIVYCFAYVSAQGHKTNIIDVTDVIPILNYGNPHGLEPNKRADIAIKLGCFKLSDNFDKVEIYSLFRSSLNGDITVRKVCSKQISSLNIYSEFIQQYIDGKACLTSSEIDPLTRISMNGVEVIDENRGEIISYQELLNRFNSLLIASTLTIKNNSLFLGNIKTNNYSVLKGYLNSDEKLVGVSLENKTSGTYIQSKFYSLNKYYVGIQLQDKYGNWTPTINVGEITYDKNIKLSSGCVNFLLENGYVAVRAMMADNIRLRNALCEGFAFRTFSIDSGKYGIDYYAAYADNVDNALYNSFTSANVYNVSQTNYWDIYSPDVEFNENFYYNKDNSYKIEYNVLSFTSSIKTDISISGNIGTLFNHYDSDIGKFYYDSNSNKFIWYDAITKYQEALQLQFGPKASAFNTNDYSHISDLCSYNIHEKTTKYKIYVWQPSGSLNDSNGQSSVLNYKKIGWTINYLNCKGQTYSDYRNEKLYLFDGTNNNIPLGTNGLVYGGTVNQKILQKQWSTTTTPNTSGNDIYFDDNEYNYKDYTRSTLKQTSFVGFPIEIITSSGLKYNLIDFTVNDKLTEDSISVTSDADVRYWNNTTIERKSYSTVSWNQYFQNENGKALPILVSNFFTRNNQIPITYKTTKHLVAWNNSLNSSDKCFKCLISSEGQINNVDIEKSQWIVCSRKQKLVSDSTVTLDVRLNDVYNWSSDSNLYYAPLISEPYSQYDINQVYFLVKSQGLSSYINPTCKYDKFVFEGGTNLNVLTLSNEFYNKLNIVYNQKNNFFVFSGMTRDTVTDDTLENTILYSDMKLANEKEDSFVNFPTTNFYTIDSNINTINKLITYNDKILCFSDDAISQILYNENVVINTESVQSLSLASTDKVTGSQLITNTYGCLNKWSIGIFNNDLYFIDDLNNKLMVYNGEFLALNEKLGIETLNNKLIKNKVWNPNSWGNTKFNIDKYVKDIHYTNSDYDIAFNSELGSFTSIYSYENISFIETIGSHTIAFKYNSGNTNAVYLREGNYNQFFGTYKPFYTTVIVNQNSIVNKTLSYIEYSSEAYSISNNTLVPQHDYTFSHIEFWNDYQESKDSHKVKIDYKMYGQSLLKRKFRIWRINRFRDYTRLPNRNYDMLSNTWHYMKLLTDGTALEQNKKLTFHWLNVYYR